jgi:predicted nuclease with TOPRIM domain
MASDNTPKTKATDTKLAIQKAEEAMQSFLGKQLIQEKYQSLKLEAQVEKQKEEIEELKDSQSESSNLELHVKRLIHEKASLNDKIEQLTDDLNKYQELYARAKGVAQALGKAVSILTSEVKNG